MLVCACLAAAQGCSTDVNARRTIGAARGLPAIGPAEITAADTGLTGRLDRGDWTPVEFRVPVDGTVHGPLWKTATRFDDDDRRAHGLYPTAASALDLGTDRCDDTVRTAFEPAWVLFDLVAMPVRAVLSPAWTKEQGPSMYKRWHTGEYMAGPMPVDDGGEE